MAEKFKLNLIKKEVENNKTWGVPVKKFRWFVETNDGFDGTAQGYGYKTPQAVYKAYAYFKSKDQREQNDKEVKQFLIDNPVIDIMCNAYFSEEECLWRIKNEEPTSIKNMLKYIENESEIMNKLLSVKHLWKTLMKHYLK